MVVYKLLALASLALCMYALVHLILVLPLYLSARTALCRLQEFTAACSSCVFTILVQYRGRNYRDKKFAMNFVRQYPSGNFAPDEHVFRGCPTEPVFDCCLFQNDEVFCDQPSFVSDAAAAGIPGNSGAATGGHVSNEFLWDCFFTSDIVGADVTDVQVGKPNFLINPLVMAVVGGVLAWVFAELA